MKKSRSFTLIELLVVIAIIAILASLTMSSVSSARQRAVQTQCLNNLRQIGTAIVQYQMDQGNRFPREGQYGVTAGRVLQGYNGSRELDTIDITVGGGANAEASLSLDLLRCTDALDKYDIFICPSSGLAAGNREVAVSGAATHTNTTEFGSTGAIAGGETLSYAYALGMTISSKPDSALCTDRLLKNNTSGSGSNHIKWGGVLYVDGSVAGASGTSASDLKWYTNNNIKGTVVHPNGLPTNAAPTAP